jgi:hypothetical protein
VGLLERTSFARGWAPDADPVNGPIDALLRADNFVLDELGALATRRGSTKLNGSALADTDVHSLFTVISSSGTKIRFGGLTNTVYKDAIAQQVMAGSGDISFGSHLGQVVYARSTSKKKHDGTTQRGWGVAAPGQPTFISSTADGKTFSTCNSGDNPSFSADEEDTGNPLTFADGQDGTPSGAVTWQANPETKRGSATLTYGGPTNFTAYDAGTVGTDDDLLRFYVQISEPAKVTSITLLIDVNAGDFKDDYYVHEVTPGESTPLSPSAETPIPIGATTQNPTRGRVRNVLSQVVGTAVPIGTSASNLRGDKPVSSPGWNKLQIRRGDLLRIGSTTGKDWTTVRAIRVVFTITNTIAFFLDDIRLVSNQINGRYKWIAVSAFNSGQYVGLSAPSPASAETQVQGSSAQVAASGGDGNEVWWYRMGGVMDAFYRVAVTSSGNLSDTLSDIDAIALGLKLQTDNGPPPDNIIGIAGPYYDRLFVLTSDGYLWPSRQTNPDSFATGQVIRVAGTDERAYWVRKALGGLYVGTSKDIYRIEGTGAEQPDGSIDFRKTDLNIDHPPVSDGVAQDGNSLVYFANDGWRTLDGTGSVSIVGLTSLLYKGYTRHGVSPVNVTGGRFRAAIGNGHILAITPEGANTDRASVIYRLDPARNAWYRHLYPQNFRSILREPDGLLIAGDDQGFVWQLDVGTIDGATGLPITIWTRCDDNGQPFHRKDLEDLRVTINTQSQTVACAVHLDGSDVAATSVSLNNAAVGGLEVRSLEAIRTTACRRVQLRMTGTASGAVLYSYGVTYRDHPILLTFVDAKPEQTSTVRRRFAGLHVVADTLGLGVVVTPVLDGTDLATTSITTSEPLSRHIPVTSVVGRDLWGRVNGNPFELYQITPLILETLPALFRGPTPRALFGSPGTKVISGVQVRACTLGATVTVSVLVDGTTAATFSIASGADDPADFTYDATAAIEGVEFSLSFSGDVELYTWAPIVTARRPLGVTRYDSGPIDLGERELVWLRKAYVKARVSAALTIAVYMDGQLVATGTSPSVLSGADAITPIDFGRGVKGRQARIVMTSTGVFYPYWVKFTRRTSGLGSEKPTVTVPLALETGATA